MLEQSDSNWTLNAKSQLEVIELDYNDCISNFDVKQQVKQMQDIADTKVEPPPLPAVLMPIVAAVTAGEVAPTQPSTPPAPTSSQLQHISGNSSEFIRETT